MKGLVLLACAVAAGMVLRGSAAGAAQDGSAGPRTPSIAVAKGRIPLSRAAGLARSQALAGVPAKGSYAFLLKLGTESTAHAYDVSLSHGPSAARTAAVDQLAAVHAAQSRVIAALPSGSHVLYQTHAVLAGVAVYTKVANLPALQRISGVAAVYPIAPKRPSLSYSVFLEHAPQVWATAAPGSLGENSTVAIIDTGVDFTHADLGGPGTTAAYQAARAGDTVAPTYPDPSKVAGGFDFAGDAYDASDPAHSTPSPDPNPLDCNGHGTHVAGITAGYGENAADGSKFTGNYTTLPTDIASYQALFRIGPGMAPKAKLYAYKIFGCAEEATTDLVGAAIDRAEDPNDDGNTADHVDVINMSLGSDYGSPQDGDSALANAASALGVTVVAAAGNGGDSYDIGGSPGNAQRVIGVAASADAYSQIDTLHVNGLPHPTYGAQRSVNYTNWATLDLDGAVVKLTDANNLDGCDPLNSTDAARVAGKIAFLEWTDDDTTRRCGSAARADNVFNAGGIGVILGEDEETFAAGIAGNAHIPVVQVVKSAADDIRTALNASQSVVVTGTSANDFTQLIPSNDDKVAGFSSRGIREAGDVKPDVSGVGASVFSAAVGTGNQGISFSGTSMATPEVAGLAALVHSEHTAWSPEQVKADLMNTAEQDIWTDGSLSHAGTRYAPNRVGAGRIDAKAALDNHVLAYVADDPGAVSASFGPVAVTAPTTLTKTIVLANTGGTAQTYDTAYDALTSVPGAVYSVSPAQVTVAAGSSETVTLALSISPAQLTKTIDPTVARTQAGLPREYVADASGRVLFTPTAPGVPTLRVPVYSAPRPVSTMTQPASLKMPNGAIQKALLRLGGQGIRQGSGVTSIQSAVAGFELQAQSGALPACGGSLTTGCIHVGDERASDLKYVGTTSDAPELESIGQNPLTCTAQSCGLEYFAITTQGPWHSPASQNEYDVVIDTNGDGTPDAIMFNTRLTGTDIFVSATEDLSGNVLDVELVNDRFGDTDTALFDSDTLVMPVAIASLPGVSSGHSRIRYGVLTFGQFSADPVDSVGLNGSLHPDGTLTADVLNPGVAVFGSFNGGGSPLLYVDEPGTIDVRRNAAAYAADRGQGALIVHFQNAVGNKAQIVDLGHTVTVKKSGVGKGTVTSSPAGVKCGATCVGSFATGSSAKLTAKPSATSMFAGWSGAGCHRTGTCRVTLKADVSVKATFKHDRTRPRMTRLKVKPNHRRETARLTFRATDAQHGAKGLKFRCKLDRQHFKSCHPAKLYRHLGPGKHTVLVKAIDRAGNASKPLKRKFRD